MCTGKRTCINTSMHHAVISDVCEYEIKNGSLSMMHINTANLSHSARLVVVCVRL